MIRVQTEPLDPWAELARFARGRTDVGGVASFTGLVRDEHAGERVRAMTLEHYPGMTERQLAALETEARRRWELQDCLVLHRVGRMLPGEAIVLVATAAPHRQAALDALVIATDVYTWKLLRRDMARSAAATEATMKGMIRSAIAAYTRLADEPGLSDTSNGAHT